MSFLVIFLAIKNKCFFIFVDLAPREHLNVSCKPPLTKLDGK